MFKKYSYLSSIIKTLENNPYNITTVDYDKLIKQFGT